MRRDRALGIAHSWLLTEASTLFFGKHDMVYFTNTVLVSQFVVILGQAGVPVPNHPAFFEGHCTKQTLSTFNSAIGGVGITKFPRLQAQHGTFTDSAYCAVTDIRWLH